MLSARILLLAGGAYFVDLFLRWFDASYSGWDVALISTSGWLVIGLLLVELTRLRGVWATPSSSLLSFFLAAASGVFCIAGLVHLKWNAGVFTQFRLSAFKYGAWTGLALALALLVGATLRLREYERAVPRGRST